MSNAGHPPPQAICARASGTRGPWANNKAQACRVLGQHSRHLGTSRRPPSKVGVRGQTLPELVPQIAAAIDAAYDALPIVHHPWCRRGRWLSLAFPAACWQSINPLLIMLRTRACSSLRKPSRQLHRSEGATVPNYETSPSPNLVRALHGMESRVVIFRRTPGAI
jgi:hypothetical protein